MRFLRLLNPIRHLRLEREAKRAVAARAKLEDERAQMVRARDGAKRAAQSFYESIGRQATPGSLTQALAQVVLLDGRVKALEVAAGLATEYLRTGRTDAAKSTLSAILDTVPADQREAS